VQFICCKGKPIWCNGKIKSQVCGMFFMKSKAKKAKKKVVKFYCIGNNCYFCNAEKNYGHAAMVSL